ncbi:36112_t:CDS:2, partial [Racocetra persica]
MSKLRKCRSYQDFFNIDDVDNVASQNLSQDSLTFMLKNVLTSFTYDIHNDHWEDNNYQGSDDDQNNQQEANESSNVSEEEESCNIFEEEYKEESSSIFGESDDIFEEEESDNTFEEEESDNIFKEKESSDILKELI